MDHHNQEEEVPDTTRNEFVRLPGLFRRWEIEQVLELGADFHFEEAGLASDGTSLVAVYRREHSTPNPQQEH